MKNIMRKILLVMPLLCLTSCSTQAWYTGVQNAQTAHCLKVPASEYDDCIDQTTENYNEYEKKRIDLTGEPNSTK